MKSKIKVMSCMLALVIAFSLIPVNQSFAYVTNGHKVSNPKSVKVFVAVDLYNSSSRIYNYSKKWNACSEINITNTDNIIYANIVACIVDESTGNYGVTTYKFNGNSAIAFYKAWINASDAVKNETVVHEVGHSLGLAHTQSANNGISVMRATGFNDKAYPLSDDKKGITKIY